MNQKQAYEILGASPNDSNTAIKVKYRKLMSAYHPDVVGSDS